MRIEHWWFTAPLRLRSILRRRRMERELEEELQFHLDHKIEEGVAQGLSPHAARLAALRAMDGLEQRKEEMRDMRRVHWLTDFFDDVHYALRSLRRTPALTALVAGTLAVGIGIPSAVFPLFDGLILRPYPVPRPREVLTLVSTSQDNSFGGFSHREYLDIRNTTHSYNGVIANAEMEAVGFSARPGESPRVKGGMMVSGNYFRVLGVEPVVGRSFRNEEDQVAGRNAVVVLSADFWKQEFGGSSTVLGQLVRLNGTDFTVIGVAPDTFTGMQIFEHPDFYMPLAMAPVFSTDARKNLLEDRDARELKVRARLRPDTTRAQAQAELALLAKTFEREYPKLNRGRGAAVHTELEMRTRSDEGTWKMSVIFVILGLAVLLVACTNVAGLLLTRGQTRTREIAVRLAIGAGRFRLLRLLLTETLILALLGGAGGVAIAYGGVKFLRSFRMLSDLPVAVPVRMDIRVLSVCLALTLLSALLCGLAPGLQAARMNLLSGLKAADIDLPGRRRMWGRDALVVAQISVSLMLLTAAFLMVRGFQRTWSEGAGFASDHLLMARFDPRLLQYDTSQTQQFYKLLAERMRSTPGVESAALTQNVPMGQDNWQTIAFVPENFEMPRGRENFASIVDAVDEGYFDTMAIPIVRGRGCLPSDTADAPRVAVVNEQFARHFWPGVEAVGRRIRLGRSDGLPVEIVGVSRTIRYRSSAERPRDFLYVPLAQQPVARLYVMLRSAVDPQQMIATLKQASAALAPNLPVFETRSYDEYYRNYAIEGPLFAIDLVITMGAAGFLLAIAGLYGLVAYNAARRTREIGIRIALGAQQRDVLRMVMSRGLKLVAIGTAVGLAMGFGVERLLKAAVFGTGGVDFAAYATLVPALFLVAMLAAFVPARRASRIAPTQALRYE